MKHAPAIIQKFVPGRGLLAPLNQNELIMLRLWPMFPNFRTDGPLVARSLTTVP